jgi:CBS-domain-containing membrane protein
VVCGIERRRWPYLSIAVVATGLVTAKKTDTVRSAMMNMMNRHCGAIPVVEGEVRLIGRVTLREVLLPLSRVLGVSFPRFKTK